VTPLLIVAGLVSLYWLIEKRKQAQTSATITAANNLAEAQTAGASGTPATIGTLAGEQQTAQLESMAVSSLSAIPIAGPAIAAVGNIVLAQHTARLKGATNENQAADQVIPAFDADLAQIVSAYNAGQITAAQAIAGAQQVDAQVKAYLKAQVGAPGTAWSEYGAMGPCNKNCTVGCCIYWNDLHPAIVGAPTFANGTVGLIPVLQAGSGLVYVPEVYPPSNTAYGNYQRAAYSLSVIKPANVTQQNTGVLATLGL
jgi:hypothetical protein